MGEQLRRTAMRVTTGARSKQIEQLLLSDQICRPPSQDPTCIAVADCDARRHGRHAPGKLDDR